MNDHDAATRTLKDLADHRADSDVDFGAYPRSSALRFGRVDGKEHAGRGQEESNGSELVHGE